MEAKLIEQVLVNLLDNAVKHTPKGKEISIFVKEDLKKRVAVFCVSDRGRRFSSEDLPHIFQMFYTTHEKGPDAQRGVGLGLAICETIVTAHGGTIEAHNRKDGSGAEVTFTLPMEDETYAK
jgi:two-component system sensor histidine kinase KdpD